MTDMTDNDIQLALSTLTDGQSFRVTTSSGRVVDGIFDAAQSSHEAGLYFEDARTGKELRADWEHIAQLDYRSARAAGAGVVPPPEHPLAPRSGRKTPYTIRNR